MKRITLSMLFWLAILMVSSVYAASVPVGEVAAIRGDARAIGSDQGDRQLSLKTSVFAGDVLVTGKKARLQIMFKDNSIISMGPESEITVSDYSLSDRGGVMKTKVKEGAFHIMGGSIAKESPENFVTETPVATIGIRGSMFALNVRDNKLSVVFLGGKGIDVFNSAGSVAITNPGFGTIVTGVKSIPESPRSFAGDELQTIVEMAKPGEKDEDALQNQKPGEKPAPGKPPEGQNQPGNVRPQGKPQAQSGPQNQGWQQMNPPGPRPPGSSIEGANQPVIKPPLPGSVGVINAGNLPQNTFNNLINSSVENNLNVIVQDEQRIATRGRHQSLWEIESEATSGVTKSETSTVEANLLKGHVEGFVQNQQGVRSGFSFDLPGRDPSAPYSGFQKLQNIPAKRFINGLEEHPENMKIGYSSTGTFLIFGLEDLSLLTGV